MPRPFSPTANHLGCQRDNYRPVREVKLSDVSSSFWFCIRKLASSKTMQAVTEQSPLQMKAASEIHNDVDVFSQTIMCECFFVQDCEVKGRHWARPHSLKTGLWCPWRIYWLSPKMATDWQATTRTHSIDCKK